MVSEILRGIRKENAKPIEESSVVSREVQGTFGPEPFTWRLYAVNNKGLVEKDSPEAKLVQAIKHGAFKQVTIYENTVVLYHIARDKRIEELQRGSASTIPEIRDAAKNQLMLSRITFKQEFHLLKIMHTLFPDNVPDILRVSATLSLAERTRVKGESVGRHYLWNDDISKMDRIKIKSLVGMLKILGFGVDRRQPSANFIKNQQGSINYIDDIEPIVGGAYTVPALTLAIEMKKMAGMLQGNAYDEARQHLRSYKILQKLRKKYVRKLT